MKVRNFALIYGIAFLVIGVAGFIPQLMSRSEDMPHLAVHGPSTGYLFGLFPLNIAHTLVHIAFGIWGLVAFRSVPATFLYARGVAVIYGVLTILGLMPYTNTVFGLVPIFGHDVWLHFVLAAGAAIFAWGPLRRERGVRTDTTSPAH
jgi:Domain of unknown function (DUF4383)